METEELEMRFKINDEIVTLFIPVDGSDHLFKVTNNDQYTVNYLIELINNGFISLKEPMESISRLDDTGTEILIYPSRESQEISEDITAEEVADSIEESRTECLKVNDTKLITYSELWTYEAVMALLMSMSTHIDDLNHPKKKKFVFSNISNDLLSKKFNYTEKACYNKWRSLLRSYKSTKDKMKSTGQGATRFLFFNQIDELIGDKPSNSSGNTLESSSIPSTAASTSAAAEIETETEYDTNNSENQNKLKNRKRKNKQDIREEAKQRRHEERMRMEERKLEVEERKCTLIEKFIEKI